MGLSYEEQKREKFRKLLLNLSKSQLVLKASRDKSLIYKTLEEIYDCPDNNEEFRHYYSDIFAILTQVDTDPALGTIDILADNIRVVKKGYRSQNMDEDNRKIDVTKQINKLFDHVSLDVARITYMKRIEQETTNTKNEINEIIAKLEDKEKELEIKVDKSREEANKMQKEYITILGIFSSVVLAFIGGIAFSTSVLENINKASIFRQLIIVITIAFVFINMIYLLVRFIIDINTLDDNKVQYNRYIKKVNITLLLIAVSIIIAWIIDVPYIVEKFQNLYKK